jgi:hypothetical protein
VEIWCQCSDGLSRAVGIVGDSLADGDGRFRSQAGTKDKAQGVEEPLADEVEYSRFGVMYLLD